MTDAPKLRTQADVTAQWRQYLTNDLALYHRACSMVQREKNEARLEVLYVAVVTLKERLQTDLHQLGGLGSDW